MALHSTRDRLDVALDDRIRDCQSTFDTASLTSLVLPKFRLQYEFALSSFEWFENEAALLRDHVNVSPDDGVYSLDDSDFILSGRVSHLIRHLENSKSVLVKMGMDPDPWVAPFEREFRESLLSIALQCFRFRGKLQTLQDVVGGCCFDVRYFDMSIATLRALASSIAINLHDHFHFQTQVLQLMRETLRFHRWMATRPNQSGELSDRILKMLNETNLVETDLQTPDARHSPDFRSVSWYGKKYSFTPNQANAVKFLWKAWKNKTPEVSDVTLLDAIGNVGARVRDVFKETGNAMNPAWETMIQRGRRDTCKLMEPDNPQIPT